MNASMNDSHNLGPNLPFPYFRWWHEAHIAFVSSQHGNSYMYSKAGQTSLCWRQWVPVEKVASCRSLNYFASMNSRERNTHKTSSTSTDSSRSFSQENLKPKNAMMACRMRSFWSQLFIICLSLPLFFFSHLFRRAFQTFGGFTSGIGIRYGPSSITNNADQSVAKNLTIGQRVLPQIFLRAADSRPVEIQDLLPSNGLFKLLVFLGDTSDPEQLEKVRAISKELEALLKGLEFCDVIPISSAKKANVRYNDVPHTLWSHWSK